MTYDLDLDEIPFGLPPVDGPAICEGEDEVWAVAPGEAEQLVEIMRAPLTRAINAWTNRINEEPLPSVAERGDLDDRIEEEAWLLRIHGYGAMTTRGQDYRHASVHVSDVILPPRYAYDVYSLDDLAEPSMRTSRRTFPATGGRQPGEFEQARDLAEVLGGAVILKQIRWYEQFDINGFEIEERPKYDECVYASDKITPTAAYEAFMQQYEDGYVIDRFLAVFEHMKRREHRNIEAITERKPAGYQRLGEIAFHLGEVRAWRAYRDSRVARGKI